MFGWMASSSISKILSNLIFITLLSTSKRYQKQPSSSLGTHIFHDLLATNPPGAEHSRIWAQGSNTGDIHPEGLDLLARTLTNFPLKFLYEEWKKVSKALLGAPFKYTHNLLLVSLASKK